MVDILHRKISPSIRKLLTFAGSHPYCRLPRLRFLECRFGNLRYGGLASLRYGVSADITPMGCWEPHLSAVRYPRCCCGSNRCVSGCPRHSHTGRRRHCLARSQDGSGGRHGCSGHDSCRDLISIIYFLTMPNGQHQALRVFLAFIKRGSDSR